MVTSSHAYWALRLSRARPERAWLVLGAVAPDLPAFAVGAALARKGVRSPDLIDRTYHRGASRRVQLTAHSVIGWGVLGCVAHRGGRRRTLALAQGGLSHLFVDAFSHHDDAWPFFWPLSESVWRAPSSYWQREHGARAWVVAELMALGVSAARDRSRLARLAVVPIATVVLLPLCSRGHRGTSATARASAP